MSLLFGGVYFDLYFSVLFGTSIFELGFEKLSDEVLTIVFPLPFLSTLAISGLTD
jgi:hypothetical protein